MALVAMLRTRLRSAGRSPFGASGVLSEFPPHEALRAVGLWDKFIATALGIDIPTGPVLKTDSSPGSRAVAGASA